MEEILSENELPVQVRYAGYNTEFNSTLKSIIGVNILIIKTYVEDYMQGNCMEESKIYFFCMENTPPPFFGILLGGWHSVFVRQSNLTLPHL